MIYFAAKLAKMMYNIRVGKFKERHLELMMKGYNR